MSLSATDIQKLDQVFNARSVALIGATESVERVGYQLLEALIIFAYTKIQQGATAASVLDTLFAKQSLAVT